MPTLNVPQFLEQQLGAKLIEKNDDGTWRTEFEGKEGTLNMEEFLRPMFQQISQETGKDFDFDKTQLIFSTPEQPLAGNALDFKIVSCTCMSSGKA